MTKIKQMEFRLIAYFVGLWFLQANVFAQISEGGVPPSFQFQTTRLNRTATVQIPFAFNLSELRLADEQKVAQGAPLLACARLIDVDLNPSNSGTWNMLPGGIPLWQLNMQAKGAIALMVYYSDFFIPAGGELFIYNAEKTQILGAYTRITNPAGGRFATEFIAGDDITLEYVAAPSGEMPRIEIEAIGYGYNHLTIQNGSVSLRRPSGSCEVNINCEEGDAWQNQKKGVCSITQRIGNITYLCSGSLVNNTARDLKPYILTAYHCACDNNYKEATADEMNQWIFYFHKELTTCDNQSSPMASKTITGCKKIAATTVNKESDGLLLLANTSIPASYNVYYNGWDRRNNPAKSGVTIHHPQGDYKKISTFHSQAIHYTFNDGTNIGDTHAHWNVVFDETVNGHGVTDDGSSGCPLFNGEKLIVGTLTGGNSTCSYANGINLYGKLNYHWDKYKSHDSTRMDVWLDPIRSGVEILSGSFHQVQLPSPTNLKAVYQNQTVLLTWSAPSSMKPQKYYVYNNNTKIGETASLSYTDISPQFGTRTYSVSAVYETGNESDFANVSISIMEYNAPVNVSVAYTSSQQQVAVQWDPPVYEQTVYWGESNALYQITLNKTIPFYFGQMWNANDLKPFHKKTITAVKFIPIRNNTYEIWIMQGNRTYRQALPRLTTGEINVIQLDTAYVIDSEKDLIVAFYVAKHSASSNEYPAVCDGGPAVQGKGNIYSFDGQSWSNLSDDLQNSDEFDYNFFIAAVVSSIEKDIPVPQTNRSSRSNPSFTKLNTAELRKATLPVSGTITLRSIRPAAFPEATGYRIYRNNIRIASVSPVPRRYLDDKPVTATSYQVAALYQTDEGKRSDPVTILPVDNVKIEPTAISLYPVVFSNHVELSGYEQVSRIEVYHVTGRLSLQIDQPDRIVRTELLSPGVYFFRFHTGNNQYQVLKGVKKR
ncbi:MAG: T9SS type A sorting domain-containing protein [Tannerella sp.]|jgi:hypothetical protein|nr:T9SS type A sorting domain-containing protein [Tannerella sp.]